MPYHSFNNCKMTTPIDKIEHKTRDVAAALRNNCWYVYHRPAVTEAQPQPQPQRVFGARTQRGQFQVRHLTTGNWVAVAAADSLYQQ